jgi:parallel beta-helix repeat protein
LVTTVTNALDGCNLPPPPLPTRTPTPLPQRTTIFVRVSGNDANSGLAPARALRTISQAARVAPSGYRILVGPGFYAEGITTDGLGAHRNLVFEADVTGAQTGDPPGAVIVDATESVVAAGFRLTKATGTVIDGFTIRGGTDDGIVIKNESDDFVIRNCIVLDNPGAGIRVQDSARVLVFNNLVYANGREGIAIVGQGDGSADAEVINNTVYGNADRGLRIGTSIGSPGALVRNNIIQLNGIGFAPALENVKVFPTSEPDYDANFNLVFPATYLPIDLAGDDDVDADAQFIDAGERDFRLSFESPAIDAGGSLSPDLEAQLSSRTTERTSWATDLGYHFVP